MESVGSPSARFVKANSAHTILGRCVETGDRMSGEFPNFHTPYVEVEQVIQGLRIPDRELLSFYIDAAISLLHGKSRSEVESELVSKGLAPEKAQEVVHAVQRTKRWKVRWNGIRTVLFGLFLMIVGLGGLLAGALGVIVVTAFVPVGAFKVAVGIRRIVAA
jgi:hypothetical protein